MGDRIAWRRQTREAGGTEVPGWNYEALPG